MIAARTVLLAVSTGLASLFLTGYVLAQDWIDSAETESPHNGHTTSVPIDGRLLVTGSFEDGAGASAEIFDPASHLWASVADMGSERGGPHSDDTCRRHCARSRRP